MSTAISEGDEKLKLVERLVSLSVELHSLNTKSQRALELSLVQWAVLRRVINLPGISAGSLAEESGIHPSTLTPTLSRLEGMGLIYIYERPKDLRRKMIVVSAKGYHLCQRVEGALLEVFGRSDSSKAVDEVFEMTKASADELSHWNERSLGEQLRN